MASILTSALIGVWRAQRASASTAPPCFRMWRQAVRWKSRHWSVRWSRWVAGGTCPHRRWKLFISSRVNSTFQYPQAGRDKHQRLPPSWGEIYHRVLRCQWECTRKAGHLQRYARPTEVPALYSSAAPSLANVFYLQATLANHAQSASSPLPPLHDRASTLCAFHKDSHAHTCASAFEPPRQALPTNLPGHPVSLARLRSLLP